MNPMLARQYSTDAISDLGNHRSYGVAQLVSASTTSTMPVF